MTDRIPPQNLEAEKAVLGACLIENRVIPEVAAILGHDDFYLPSHRKAYEGIMALFNESKTVDVITLDSYLKVEPNQRPTAADLCGMAENALPSHAVQHARLVKEAAQRRKLLEILIEAEQAIYSQTEDPLEVAGRMSSRLSALGNGVPKDFTHISEAVVKTLKQIEKAHETGNLVTGIPTGLKNLDQGLRGIHPGELFILAGRPSMGKTALAVTVAKGAAQRGYPVAFLSAESPIPKIILRMLAASSGIENRNLRGGNLQDGDFRRLTAVGQRLGNLPLWLLDSDRRWDRITAKIRALKLREPPLALVVIDYVGLLSAPVPGGERYLEIGRISSEAKALAVELEMGVVLLSQLNREVEGRMDKKPRLSDLRESGCLEQDADVVGLLYRPSYYDPNFRPGDLAELDIAKNRDGSTGIIKLRFNEETVSFSDWVEPVPGRDIPSSEREDRIHG